ncbi:MAG: hypothetical protein QGG34_09150 [SAR202 cluster bacterium]|nr:hypothetical protein [SAR202 cluster bacterium]MDP7226120.1 hypothetical protein [SAR202 cluster bacterium]HJO83831.1 hypothetical protein [SAR202 cluster bacterium]
MNDEVQIESDCMHYWVIDEPNGPTSAGTCKICGQIQEFRNSIQGSGWDRDGGRGRRAKRARS